MAFMTGGGTRANGFFAQGKLLTHRMSRVGGLKMRARQFSTAPTKPGGSNPERSYGAQALQCKMPASLPRRPIESRTTKPEVRTSIPDEEAWLTGTRSASWYTGLSPTECPGFNPAIQQLQSLPLPNLANCTREATLAYLNNTWTITELLFSSLQGSEAFLRSPDHGLRHPLIFYYGHPAVLYINKLCVAGLLPHGVNGFMEDHFETGVDEMSWDDMSKNNHPWPRVSEVHAYRQTVYEILVNLINTHLPSEREGGIVVNQSHPLWALYLGFEHERIHHETSSVLIRETPLKFVLRPRYWPENHSTGQAVVRAEGRFESLVVADAKPVVAGVDYPVNEMIPMAPKIVSLGKPYDFPSFGWDNEYGSKQVLVEGIEVSKHMVTNGEFLEFVKDAGYTNSVWWSKSGWEWRQFRNAKWPKFWQRIGAQGRNVFGLRTMFEVVEMPWDWPAVVNHYEGKAYCKWKAAKLGVKELRFLTEAEHHAIRDSSMHLPLKKVSQDPVLNDALMDDVGINSNLCVGSETPVTAYKPNSNGFTDVMGNAWEWTEDWFHSFPGFKPHPVYEDFSVPCFDDRHNMIMGGSWASSGANGSSVFSRFAFRPHFHQHAGFRYVQETGAAAVAATLAAAAAASSATTAATSPAAGPQEGQHKYETNAQISAYLSLHFGQCSPCAQYTVLPQAPKFRANLAHALLFPQRTAALVADACSRLKSARVGQQGAANPTRALDLGCAVGGASFELTKYFDQVVGVDFSPSLIQAANAVKNGALTNTALNLAVAGEGETVSKTLSLTGPKADCTCLAGADPKRVEFLVGDATALPPLKQLTGADDAPFDAVLLANLLCRLPEPLKCLDRLPLIVRPGGIVVFVSPYSWLEEFTKKDKWFGGFVKAGSPVSSADTLVAEMKARGFELKESDDMPLLIPDHARKFQYIVSNARVFQKL